MKKAEIVMKKITVLDFYCDALFQNSCGKKILFFRSLYRFQLVSRYEADRIFFLDFEKAKFTHSPLFDLLEGKI